MAQEIHSERYCPLLKKNIVLEESVYDSKNSRITCLSGRPDLCGGSCRNPLLEEPVSMQDWGGPAASSEQPPCFL